jgi:hypothetical protein
MKTTWQWVTSIALVVAAGIDLHFAGLPVASNPKGVATYMMLAFVAFLCCLPDLDERFHVRARIRYAWVYWSTLVRTLLHSPALILEYGPLHAFLLLWSIRRVKEIYYGLYHDEPDDELVGLVVAEMDMIWCVRGEIVHDAVIAQVIRDLMTPVITFEIMIID